jgi:hypothetical protein
MALETLHEKLESLTDKTLDMRRATASLIEELEAISNYQQRVDATGDSGLKAILAHNRDEEKEHAVMLIEWLRRGDEKLAEEIEAYVRSDSPIEKLVKGH